MSPKRTHWSAVYHVHFGTGGNRRSGLKVVDLGPAVDHHHAVKAAEHAEEARQGTVKAVLERAYAHSTASIMSAVEKLPIFT